MRKLIKLLLIALFFAANITVSATTLNLSNNQLIQTEFINKEKIKESNPINFYGAALFLVIAVCAYRLRKKII